LAHRELIITLAAKDRLPAVYSDRLFGGRDGSIRPVIEVARARGARGLRHTSRRQLFDGAAKIDGERSFFPCSLADSAIETAANHARASCRGGVTPALDRSILRAARKPAAER
jgi:hypothetical protein